MLKRFIFDELGISRRQQSLEINAASFIKHKSLDAMIGGVDDMEIAGAVATNGPRVVELARFAAG